MSIFNYSDILQTICDYQLEQTGNAISTTEQRVVCVDRCILTTSSSLPPSGEGVDGGLSVTGGQTMKSIVTKHSIASASIHRTMLQLYGLLSNTMVCLQFTLTDRQTVNATTNAIKTTSNATKNLHTNAAKKRPKKLRKKLHRTSII